MIGSGFRVAVSIFCLFVAGIGHAANLAMNEGEWETVSESSFRMKGFSMPPRTFRVTQCMTRENAVPKQEKEGDCKAVKYKVSGNRVTWAVVCPKGDGEGEITYDGTGKSYAGNLRMKMVENGETMTMQMRLSGKYLGPCPKGKKSGPTGGMAERQAQAEQAMARAKQAQAEQEAARRKAEEFLGRTVVPAEAPGGCDQDGFRLTAKCRKEVGPVDLQPGLYEITAEEGYRIPSGASSLSGEKRRTACVNGADPVPSELRSGAQPRDVKWGKGRITWSGASSSEETKGGVVFRGDSFEGVLTKNILATPGVAHLQVTKVAGKRVGDGQCPKGMEYTSSGREYTAKEREGIAEKGKKLLDNPVKGIRNLFGF